MKVCPNCDESFGDDLNFCDVDGTRLERHRDVASTGDRSRAWSFLGAGLLIGALALSAASIIFFPKSRVTPSIASSLPSTGTTPGTAPGEATAPATQQPEIVVEEALAEEAPPVETKKKEKVADLTNANANVSVPNPKAVALEAEDPVNSSRRASEPVVAPPVEVRDPEPPPARPVAVESRESEKEMKPAPTTDPKKDPKAKDSKKKKDDPKEKKKGGFFGVFKKIFGKD